MTICAWRTTRIAKQLPLADAFCYARCMYIPDSYPHIGIETLPNDLSETELYQVSLELGHFTRDTIQAYYIEELGLTRIDEDAEPATEEDIRWRMQRLKTAAEDNREYMLARYISGEHANDPTTVIAGLLATRSFREESDPDQHAIEVMEWDVAKSERGVDGRRGLGGIMLRRRFRFVDDDTHVFLDVVETNTHARKVYEHYGFEQYAEPVEHGIFDAQHIPLAVSAATLKQRLGLVS